MRKCGRWWQVDADMAGPHLSLAVRGRGSLLHMTIWFILPLFASLNCSTYWSSCFKVTTCLAVCVLCSTWQIKRGYLRLFFFALCLHTWCQSMSYATGTAAISLICTWSPHGKHGDALLDLKVQTAAADKHFLRLWLWASLIHHNRRCIIRYFFFMTTDDLVVI